MSKPDPTPTVRLDYLKTIQALVNDANNDGDQVVAQHLEWVLGALRSRDPNQCPRDEDGHMVPHDCGQERHSRVPKPVQLLKNAETMTIPEFEEAQAKKPTKDMVISDALDELLRDEDPTVLWWVQMAYADAKNAIGKARIYGSAELIYAGQIIADMAHRTVTDAEAMELHIFHYCLGKLGRWVAAVRRNEQVADDTLADLQTYVTMVRRLRDVGTWP